MKKILTEKLTIHNFLSNFVTQIRKRVVYKYFAGVTLLPLIYFS